METTLTSNKSLLAWLDEKVELTKPSKIVWIDLLQKRRGRRPHQPLDGAL